MSSVARLMDEGSDSVSEVDNALIPSKALLSDSGMSARSNLESWCSESGSTMNSLFGNLFRLQSFSSLNVFVSKALDTSFALCFFSRLEKLLTGSLLDPDAGQTNALSSCNQRKHASRKNDFEL